MKKHVEEAVPQAHQCLHKNQNHPQHPALQFSSQNGKSYFFFCFIKNHLFIALLSLTIHKCLQIILKQLIQS